MFIYPKKNLSVGSYKTDIKQFAQCYPIGCDLIANVLPLNECYSCCCDERKLISNIPCSCERSISVVGNVK